MTKYYAVRKGRTPGIYQTFEEAKLQVDGFSGAEYCSFTSEEEALSYLAEEEVTPDLSKPTAYVDGSFDEKTGRYSFGCVFFYEGKEYHFKKAFEPDELSSMRNVAGEIKGAGFIIYYCVNRGIKELELYYDYIGISQWYNGDWKANLYGTMKYQEFASQVKSEIDVRFHKVKSHTNNKYNDLADQLAKEALGL